MHISCLSDQSESDASDASSVKMIWRALRDRFGVIAREKGHATIGSLAGIFRRATMLNPLGTKHSKDCELASAHNPVSAWREIKTHREENEHLDE